VIPLTQDEIPAWEWILSPSLCNWWNEQI